LADELDNILVKSSGPEGHEKISRIHGLIRAATYFEPDDPEAETLKEIIRRISDRATADGAIAEFTKKFDNVSLAPEDFRIKKEELEKAHQQLDPGVLDLLRQAIANVREYQARIFIGSWSKMTGATGIRYSPIKRVGICVPGASAPLPSTVIMTAVPAQVAGVEEIVVVSPPRYKGTIHPVILAACRELGIDEVYRIGGVQAVAALAFGTETIKPVDKIVGPGNRWVQMAKKEVFGLVGIDSIAGPSEVLILADERANAAWVAADMLSQAEHSPGSALLFTNSANLAGKVLEQLKKQLQQLGRAEQIKRCLLEYGAIVVFESIEEMIAQANCFAAEHVQVQCGDRSKQIAERIHNAGAIFIGDYSPVAVGDYWAGPSHTLPTGTSARFFSGLSANDFIKSSSLIEYDAARLADSAEAIIRLAEIEGLDAHAQSVKIRRQDR